MAIVTGASSGIGRACAVRLAEAGHRVVLVSRRRESLDAVLATLPGGGHVVHPCDVADPIAARRLIDRVIAELGRVDVLVNSAGVAPVRSVGESTPDLTRSVLALNTEAPANLLHFAWPIMTRQGRAVVVNISSLASIDPFDGFFAYAASKAALNLLTLVADREGSPHGVRCYAICPGAVETPMLRAIVSSDALPTSQTLPPDAIAEVVMQCVRGERLAEAGRPIVVASPSPPPE